MRLPVILICALVGILTLRCNAQQEATTALWFFWGNDTSNYIIYDIYDALDILRDPHYYPFLPTVLYIHGWTETPAAQSVRTVVGAYLQTCKWNTLVLGSELLDTPVYQIALDNVAPLSNLLAQQLVNLFNFGLPTLNIHLVGHSFGAHIAAYTGRYVKQLSNQRYILPRITGLDPANNLWYDNGLYKPISKSDALFVDIIHTDAGLNGAPRSTGTIDFWPNGGVRSQPGCPNNSNVLSDFCSHNLAWYFWAESLATEHPTGSFLAVRALNWMSFKSGFTDSSLYLIHMGIHAPVGFTGNWFLQTNPQKPYSRGFAGILYDRQ